MFRRMPLTFLIYLVVYIILGKATTMFVSPMLEDMFTSTFTMDMLNGIDYTDPMGTLTTFDYTSLLPIVAVALLPSILLSLIFGFLGDRLYMSHIERAYDSTNSEEKCKKKGGTRASNVILAMILLMVINTASQLI